MEQKNRKNEEEIGAEEAFRSLGRFFTWMEGKVCPSSEFREHMTKSKVEFLRGIRSLIDKRIGELEKRQPKKTEKKATRVTVE